MKSKKIFAGLLSCLFVIPVLAFNLRADINEDPYLKYSFPDAAFREFLLNNSAINIDGDGNLSDDELNAVTDIVINGGYENRIASYSGIEYFPNLKNLSILNGSSCSYLYLVKNEKLENVNLAGTSSLSTLTIGYKADLFTLDISGTNIVNLKIANCPRLYYLNLTDAPVKEVFIGDNGLLMNAYNYNEITSPDSKYPWYQYQYMLIKSNSYTNLLTTVPEGVVHIDEKTFPDQELRHYLVDHRSSCEDNLLYPSEIEATSTVNISFNDSNRHSLKGLEYFTSLKTLEVHGLIEGDSLDLRGFKTLEKLHLFCPGLKSLNVTGCSNLFYLVTFITSIDEINLYGCTKLLNMYNAYPEANYNDEGSGYEYDLYHDSEYKTMMFLKPNCKVVNVEPAPDPAPSDSGIEDFVERLYTIALGRASDPNGKADWTARLSNKSMTGADVAKGFLYSPEFLGKNMSDEEFLNVLYKVFFDRAGDPEGMSYWSGCLASGMDKQEVVVGFINSVEWANVCFKFGIISGGVAVPTVEPSPEIIAFVTRLYTTCLGREAEAQGLKDWSERLARREFSGSEVAHGFFFSGEFMNNASINNEEYVNRLYATFMNRPADPEGYEVWMGILNNGGTREEVFNGFAGSNEWATICSSYGILK